MPDEVTLREFFTQRFEHLEERLSEHAQRSVLQYEQIQKEFERAREDLRRDQAQQAQQVAQAADAIADKLKEMNMFRTQLEQERNLYVTRDRLDTAIQAANARNEAEERALAGRLDELTQRMGESERAKANLDGRFAVLGMMLVGLSVVLQIAFNFINRIWK